MQLSVTMFQALTAWQWQQGQRRVAAWCLHRLMAERLRLPLAQPSLNPLSYCGGWCRRAGGEESGRGDASPAGISTPAPRVAASDSTATRATASIGMVSHGRRAA